MRGLGLPQGCAQGCACPCLLTRRCAAGGRCCAQGCACPCLLTRRCAAGGRCREDTERLAARQHVVAVVLVQAVLVSTWRVRYPAGPNLRGLAAAHVNVGQVRIVRGTQNGLAYSELNRSSGQPCGLTLMCLSMFVRGEKSKGISLANGQKRTGYSELTRSSSQPCGLTLLCLSMFVFLCGCAHWSLNQCVPVHVCSHSTNLPGCSYPKRHGIHQWRATCIGSSRARHEN